MAMLPHIDVLTTRHRRSRYLASHHSTSNNRYYATLEYYPNSKKLTFAVRQPLTESDLSVGNWTLEVRHKGEKKSYPVYIRRQYYYSSFSGSSHSFEITMADWDIDNISDVELALYR